MSLYETLEYEVVKLFDKSISIRRYPSFTIAKTLTTVDEKLTGGFMDVFDYISGKNDQNQKIKMTTPVISTVDDQTLTTAFVMPKKLIEQPTPFNNNVAIEHVNEDYFIVITFKGTLTNKTLNKYDSILKDVIKDEQLITDNKRYILRYQPPFLPGFLKRNEIMYQVLYEENN